MRSNCEWLSVEVVDADTAVVRIAHNPYASFSRAVRPWVRRNFANLIPTTGLEFVRRLGAGCTLELLPGRDDDEPMTDDRCVTRWEFKATS